MRPPSQVAEFASKEHALEKTLDRMQNDWMGVKFEYAIWKNTGTSILRGIDELQQQLDDQLIKTQSMTASPYIGPFEDRVRIWLEKLIFLQKVWMARKPIYIKVLSRKYCFPSLDNIISKYMTCFNKSILYCKNSCNLRVA